jgi:WD40 repeat protein
LLVDVRTGEVRARFAFGLSGLGRNPVALVGLAFTPGGGHLLAGRRDFPPRSKKTGLHARQARQGPFRATLLEHHGGGLSAVALSPDGKTLACATQEGPIALWDLAGQRERPGCLGGQVACVSLAYAADDRTLAAAVGNKVQLWDTQGGAVRELAGHEAIVNALAFAPDGTRLLSAGADGVRLWDVDTATQRARYEWPIGEVRCVAFAPDGKGAAAGGQTGLVLWEIEGSA